MLYKNNINNCRIMIEEWEKNEAEFKYPKSFNDNKFIEGLRWTEKDDDDDITNLIRKYHDVNVKAMSMFNEISDKIIFKGFEYYESQPYIMHDSEGVMLYWNDESATKTDMSDEEIIMKLKKKGYIEPDDFRIMEGEGPTFLE